MGNKHAYQLDHFFVRRTDLRSVMDARSVAWGVDSDHRAIVMRMRIRRTIRRPPVSVKIDLGKLRNKDVAREFRQRTKESLESFISNFDGELTANEERRAFEDAILKAAADLLKADKGRKRMGWFTAFEAVLMAAINRRNEAQKRCNASWIPTEEDREELRAARKAVRRAVEDAREAWMMRLVDEINSRESADDQRPLNPKEVWQVIRALQKGPRLAEPITPFNLRKNQVTGTGAMCETEAENGEVMVAAQRKTFDKTSSFDPEAVNKVPLHELQSWMDKALTAAEVSKATRKLANGKSGGDSKLHAEYYKALDEDPETRCLLKKTLDRFWQSGSFPTGDIPEGPPALITPTVRRWRREDWPVRYLLENPKKAGSQSYLRYEAYKGCTTLNEALAHGARVADLCYDLKHGFLTLLAPPVDRVLGPLPGNDGEVVYDSWLMARLVLLPKKGDLSLCKNWRGICLLDISSKILSSVLVARMGELMKRIGMESQVGFRWDRGTIDGLFTTYLGLSKRKEHGLETWALFIDLVKAFDSVPRDALFAVLRRYGMPDHFVKVLIRLHYGAKVKVKIGDVDSEINSTIGVRQGSCEGPVLFLFIMQAAMETLDWPEGVSKPEFMTREYGKTTGERSSRVRDAHSFELWTSLFADDCVLLFQSRDDLIRGSNHIFAHLRKFGLCMHVGRGDTASKTEAMYFPPPRTAYEAADTSRFYVDGTGFIDFCEKFKYLGSILHYSLTSDADVDKRIASATAAFGALKNIFNSKYLSEELKGEVYKALVLPTLLYGCEAWSLREDLFKRLRSFHNRCARSMCRVNLHHTFRHHITTSSLFRRLNLLDIDSYYHNRLLRWAGHVARMPMSRAPRQLLTSWVAHSRPVGCPQMTWGRTLENALASKGISKEFKEWIAIAKDRPKWRQQTHSKPKPPDA